jgi:hypothetical protein
MVPIIHQTKKRTSITMLMRLEDQGGYQNALCFPCHVNKLMKKIIDLLIQTFKDLYG